MASLAMNEPIGIVGAGLIGRAWAIVFARAGCSVAMYDSAPDATSRCTTVGPDPPSTVGRYPFSLLSSILDAMRPDGV